MNFRGSTTSPPRATPAWNGRRGWIFWLDCDDRLDEPEREKLRALLGSLPADGSNVAYSMKCRCLPAPGQDGDTVVDHVRLFRNDPRVRWKYRIHEQILGAVRASGGEALFSDVSVTHAGYADPALRGRKLLRDLRLLEMEYAEQPRAPFTLFNLGKTLPGDAPARPRLRAAGGQPRPGRAGRWSGSSARRRRGPAARP